MCSRVVYPSRGFLRGLGEELLILVVCNAPKDELKDWLRIPLVLSAGSDRIWALLSKPNECCQIRRQGEELLAVVMERASPEQWRKWLKLPLRHARLRGNTVFVNRLLAAGASLDVDLSTCRSPTTASAFQGSMQEDFVTSSVQERSSTCCIDTPGQRCSQARPVGSESQVSASESSRNCSVPRSSSCNDSAASAWSRSAKVSTQAPSCCPGEGSRPTAGQGQDLTALAAMVASARMPLEANDGQCLHRAAMGGDVQRMRELLIQGKDKDATDLWNCTALHRAAEGDRWEAARLLLSMGANPSAQDMEGYTPLHFAAARCARIVTSDLLHAGVSLSATGANGDTPLHSACRYLSTATIRILLKWNADESIKNCDGETPADVTGVLPDGRDIENRPEPDPARHILEILAAAPAARAWRRRGWLVMLRKRNKQCGLAEVKEKECGDADETAVGDTNATTPTDNYVGCVPCGGNETTHGCGTDGELQKLVSSTAGIIEDGLFQRILLYM